MTENATDKKVGLLAPWALFARDVEAIFGPDPDVEVVPDAIPDGEGNYRVHLFVEGADKASAIEDITSGLVHFGNVTVTVEVHPCNEGGIDATLRRAFAGNPNVSLVERVDGTDSPRDGVTFVLFAPRIVQYPADDLSDYHGVRTALLRDVAANVLSLDGERVNLCTDLVGQR